MPDTFFPFSVNARTLEDGQIGPRPPLSPEIAHLPGGNTPQVISLHRMQDSTPAGPSSGYVYVATTPVGGIYVAAPGDSGVAPSLTGFSGSRVSIVPYRPGGSVQPWAYIGDTLRMGKVNSTKVGYRMGIAEPQVPAAAAVAGTQYQPIENFISTAPWTPTGTGGALTSVNPLVSTLATLYDSGTSGEASIVFSIGVGPAPNQIVFANGGIPSQPVFLEALISTASSTNIASIIYDSGTTGLCTITTTTLPATLNSSFGVYQLGGGEYVRIFNAVKGPSSVTFRCSTTVNHIAGEALVGFPSMRASIPMGGNVGQLQFSGMTQTVTTGAGGILSLIPVVTGTLSTILGSRQVQQTDVLSLLVNVIGQVPNITNIQVFLNLDPGIIDFSTNAFSWTIAPGSLSNTVVSNPQIAVSGLTRLGTNAALSLSTGVNAVKIIVNATGSVTIAYASLLLIGTYGPTGTGASSPVVYRYVYRSTEGALSNPSPPMRLGVQPTAQSVQVQTVPSPDPQTKYIDIYRGGGTFTQINSVEEDHYVGTVPNTTAAMPPITFVDALDDITASVNPLLAFDNYEPFPSIDLPASGVVNINQYTVTFLSGTNFNIRWAPGTLINIGGTIYTLYNRPQSGSQLTVLQNGGTQFNVPYQITAPVLLAQPLPALWGPTDNAGFLFGCGDLLRPGTLYFTKGNNPDSAPQTNSLEATGPDEPLMNGVILNGLSMVFSTDRAWWAYPNFSNVTAALIGTVGSPFYLVETISNRGLFARFGLCTDGGGTVFFVAKDGIYRSRGGGAAECLTDQIYSMFPHENSTQSGIPITAFSIAGGFGLGVFSGGAYGVGDGTSLFTVPPPDYTNPGGMVLAFAEDRLYFDYQDTTGTYWSLVLDLRSMVWGVDLYASPASVHANADGNALGAGVGTVDGRIHILSGTGPENVPCLLQSVMLSSDSSGWQHAKELQAEYSSLGDITNNTLQFLVTATGPGGISAPTLTLPAVLTETKQYSTIGANKFKLAQYTIFATGPFRLWAQKFEMKIGSWERAEGYRTVNPFEAFGKVNRQAQ